MSKPKKNKTTDSSFDFFSRYTSADVEVWAVTPIVQDDDKQSQICSPTLSVVKYYLNQC